MSTFSMGAAPGYQFEAMPDLSRLETRERLSQSAVDGFFAIVDKWQIPMDRASELLGGMPRSTVYKLKTAAGTLSQDELTRSLVAASSSVKSVMVCEGSGSVSRTLSSLYFPGISRCVPAWSNVCRKANYLPPRAASRRLRTCCNPGIPALTTNSSGV